MKSASVLIGESGGTTSTAGTAWMWLIGWKAVASRRARCRRSPARDQRVGRDQQVVAVGRRAGDDVAADHARGAGLVLDQHGDAQHVLQLVGDDARGDVDVPARRIGRHDADRLVGEFVGGLGGGGAGDEQCQHAQKRRDERMIFLPLLKPPPSSRPEPAQGGVVRDLFCRRHRQNRSLHSDALALPVGMTEAELRHPNLPPTQNTQDVGALLRVADRRTAHPGAGVHRLGIVR